MKQTSEEDDSGDYVHANAIIMSKEGTTIKFQSDMAQQQ